MQKKLNLPVHPGRILREDVFPEAGISVSEVALALDEPDEVLHQILAERMPLSAALCLKIGKFFDSTPEMWSRLQASYDLQTARMDERISESIKRIVPIDPIPRLKT